MSDSTTQDEDALRLRAAALLEEHRTAVFVRGDKLFAWLMALQWGFGIVIALAISPYGWEGRTRSTHIHVLAAIFLGGAISSFPLLLTRLRPGWFGTRVVVACAQMLWSALFIHLTGGRIETHFHVFGSLAFLAFYRDWRVLVAATLVVATDHFVRGLFWPESVYGIVNPEWWRFLEHAFWVVFENTVLIIGCVEANAEMQTMANRRAEVELLSQRERDKSAKLDAAVRELQSSQDALVRAEKLAAIGQLAASVGHELRNPLAAVRNANSYVSKRLAAPGAPTPDQKITQFLGIIEREVGACTKIIGDLLDFARERPLVLRPCPLSALVDEAASLVPTAAARIENRVPTDLPVPNLDRDHFRQILVNLLQNAVEAMPEGGSGTVVVSADGGGDSALSIRVADNGVGIPSEILSKIFEPLFTTKSKGTGLGLAIVASMIRAHGASIQAESSAGSGTCFTIELPTRPVHQAA